MGINSAKDIFIILPNWWIIHYLQFHKLSTINSSLCHLSLFSTNYAHTPPLFQLTHYTHFYNPIWHHKFSITHSHHTTQNKTKKYIVYLVWDSQWILIGLSTVGDNNSHEKKLNTKSNTVWNLTRGWTYHDPIHPRWVTKILKLVTTS